MNQDRINQLEKFRLEDPTDPFTKYALALEYLDINKTKSAELFDDLLKNNPNYIGTYYHAAALFTDLDEISKAEAIYKCGIAKAQELNEAHALKELQSAYLNFQYEND